MALPRWRSAERTHNVQFSRARPPKHRIHEPFEPTGWVVSDFLRSQSCPSSGLVAGTLEATIVMYVKMMLGNER